MTSGANKVDSAPASAEISHQKHGLFVALALVCLVYAFLAGLRTVTDYDLGWQMATGRWVAQHHAIFSTDVFSYTAQGQPWIYPIVSGLIFYAGFQLGGFALLSWLGAGACMGTVALLLRRGSLPVAAFAVFAIPRIAARTGPRAELFTVVLFAAFLSILWQQYQTGRARLWLLPLLMIGWVNLHLGFVSGLALLGAYAGVEILEMAFPGDRRSHARSRLKQSYPWMLATFAATLLNPWGWNIYRALLLQESAMKTHSQWITEWASVRLNWAWATSVMALRDTKGAFLSLLVVAVIAMLVAMLRKQPGAAALLAGSSYLAVRHVRLQALFACVVVVVAGTVISSAIEGTKSFLPDLRLRSILAAGVVALTVLLSIARSADLVSNRHYLGSTDTALFGAGLSWWFPERAAAFVEREHIPGQIFNAYDTGGYLVWRLGPQYRDYIDGRAIPFGPERFQRQVQLLRTPPDSPEWQQEADAYGINIILVSLARYDGLQFFPRLNEFCASQKWAPVYLDETSAVLVRHTPDTEALIHRSLADCATVRLPATTPSKRPAEAFHQWANAASVLYALGRNSEALAATDNALALFSDSANLHYLRANLFATMDRMAEAEQEYLIALDLEPSEVTWSAMAQLYRVQGRRTQAIAAFEQAAQLSARPERILVNLAYTYLEDGRAQEALQTFDEAVREAPSPAASLDTNNSFLVGIARGRAAAWRVLGDLGRAVSFQEEATRLAPAIPDLWLELADLYSLQGRNTDAQRARMTAEAISKNQ